MKNVIVIILLSFLINGVFGADEMKEVTEGDSLTLPTGLTQTQSSDRILWLYGSDRTIIATIDNGIYSTNVDERFKGNLELDTQTGSLTIKKNKKKISGLYELDINRGTTSKKFSVKVYASLPTPAIDSPQCAQTPVGSSSPKCVFLCSVQTSDQTTLSWYRGNTRVSNKISDISSSISLRLEVNYEDKNIYSCMVNNTISNKTQHLDITQLCQPCEDPGLSSGVIIGIVVPLLLVAVVAALVMYFRYKRSELEKQIESIKPKTVECKEGRHAVLQSYQEMKKGDQMLWRRVSGKVSAVASMSENDKKTYWYHMRFRGRLQLDPQTGSLIIRNLRKTDAGVYVLEIKSRGGTAYRKYKVTLSGEVETVSVKEGHDVTLVFPGRNVYNSKWEFEEKNGFIATLIIKDNLKDNEPRFLDDKSVGRFKDKLELDPKTGSLTIKNIRPEHTGLYTVMTNPGYTYTKSFNVVFDDFTETSGNESVITGFMGRIQRFCGLARIGGVFGDEKDEMKTLSVMEGGDLNLNTETEIQTDDEIIVRFGTAFRQRRPYVTIARFSKQGDEFKSAERRFKDRLKLDLTGRLTITKLKITDYGDYYLQITNKKNKSFKSFTFIVVPSVDAVKSVTKGESICLETNITDLPEEDQVLWTFGPHDMIVANTTTNRCDNRFIGRVKLDKKTGSLTISKSKTEDAGMYYLQIISGNRVRNKTFKVTVNEDDASTRVQISDDNESDEDERSALGHFSMRGII
ncbi:hypothetical protein R3I93_016927 [Phoxinus phoxinus]|uniref:Ig-like domain-containing protein n=1 Tax=Phoxinus phoxinus TaxID=58324 RepID=A0AAN9CJU3_9TELE